MDQPPITAENAVEFKAPGLKDGADKVGAWYRQMMACDWDGLSSSFKIAKKRYERLLPGHKEQERERDRKRDRSGRARPEDASERRVKQREEQKQREVAERAAARAAIATERRERIEALNAVLFIANISSVEKPHQCAAVLRERARERHGERAPAFSRLATRPALLRVLTCVHRAHRRW